MAQMPSLEKKRTGLWPQQRAGPPRSTTALCRQSLHLWHPDHALSPGSFCSQGYQIHIGSPWKAMSSSESSSPANAAKTWKEMLKLRASIAQTGSSGPLWFCLEYHKDKFYPMKYIMHSWSGWLTLQDMPLSAGAVIPDSPSQTSEVPCQELPCPPCLCPRVCTNHISSTSPERTDQFSAWRLGWRAQQCPGCLLWVFLSSLCLPTASG